MRRELWWARRKKDDENDTIITHETTTGITLIGPSCRVVEIYHVFRAGHYYCCTSLLAVDDGVRAFDVRSAVVNGGLPQKQIRKRRTFVSPNIMYSKTKGKFDLYRSGTDRGKNEIQRHRMFGYRKRAVNTTCQLF